MKIKHALIFAATSFLAVSLSAFCDGDWLSALLTNLNKWREDYPQEKVHIHFDKPFYSIGDDIWFKAYLVNTENHELSALSKVLYVIGWQNQNLTSTELPYPATVPNVNFMLLFMMQMTTRIKQISDRPFTGSQT